MRKQNTLTLICIDDLDHDYNMNQELHRPVVIINNIGYIITVHNRLFSVIYHTYSPTYQWKEVSLIIFVPFMSSAVAFEVVHPGLFLLI